MRGGDDPGDRLAGGNLIAAIIGRFYVAIARHKRWPNPTMSHPAPTNSTIVVWRFDLSASAAGAE